MLAPKHLAPLLLAGAPAAQTDAGPATGVAASVLDADIVLAARPGPGLVRSADGGATFVPYGAGLPVGVTPHQVVQHPDKDPGHEDWV